MKTIFKFFVLSIFLLCSISSKAQLVSGQDAINYQVRVTDVWWEVNSGEEPVFLFKAEPDLNNQYTILLDNVYNNPHNEEKRHEHGDGSGWDPGYPLNIDLETKTGATGNEKKFDFTYMAWDHDCSNLFLYETCAFNNDDRLIRWGGLYTPQNYSKSEWRTHYLSPSCSGCDYSQVEFRTTWRYTRGEVENEALNFGDMSGTTTTKYHDNSNRSRPSGASVFMGYNNYHTQNSSGDVFYEFELNTAKQVRISTESSSTNFDTYVYLKEKGGAYIASDNNSGSSNSSVITRDLCPGDYIVIVEGNGSATGNFRLRLTASNPSVAAGSIAVNSSSVCVGNPLPSLNNSVFPNSGLGTEDCDNWGLNVGEGQNINIVAAQRVRYGANGQFNYKYVSPGTPCNNATFGDPAPGVPKNCYTCADFTYSWEKWEAGASAWTPLAVNAATYSNPGNMPNKAWVKFRRKATVNGCPGPAAVTSNEVTINRTNTTQTVGSIAISGDDAVPPDTAPGSITSVTNASASPATPHIIWQQKIGNANWPANGEGISGAHGQTYNIPTLTSAMMQGASTISYRRGVRSGCGEAYAFTSPVTVTVYPENGKISGYVRSNLADINSGVEGITITIEQETNLDGRPLNDPDATYTTSTNSDGYYEVSNIYYGPSSASFKVRPSATNHTFDPSLAIGVVLSSSNNYTRSQNFTDNSTFTFSGKIEQTFEGTDCGLEGVEVRIYRGSSNTQYQTPKQTDNDGNYQFTVPIGTYRIEPFQLGRTFDNPSEELNISAPNQVVPTMFETTKYAISGFVQAGCNTPMGTALVRISDGCITKEVWTDETGSYQVNNLPVRDYNVSVQDYNPISGYDKQTVLNFEGIQAVQAIELNDEDEVADFTYHRPPEVIITGFPIPPCAEYPYSVLEQTQSYLLNISIYEQGSNCPVSTGSISINDQISDRGDMPTTTDFTANELEYTMLAGNPNIIYPFLKNITISVTDDYGQSTNLNLSALVTGARPRAQNFSTQSPELPLLILRDPPGDGSFSFWEETNTSETAIRFFGQDEQSNNNWLKVRTGLAISTEVLGIGTDQAFWSDTEGSHEITSYSSNAHEFIVSTTTNSRLETDESEDFIGSEGDIYVASALSFAYSIADEILFDENNCEVLQSKSLLIAKDGLETTVTYTEKNIREVVIPQLEELKLLDPAMAANYDNQISVWQQTLQLNEDLKQYAENIPNGGASETIEGFSAGIRKNVSTTETSSESSTIEFGMQINDEIATELGFEVAGTGVSGGIITSFKMETGESNTTTTTQSLTTGYELYDGDPGDQFTVRIKKDPVYNTAVFELLGGQSSCPHEEGTNARDAVTIRAENPIQTNIPPNGSASFSIFMGNISEASEARDNYLLRVKPGTNPGGALIRIEGSEYTVPIDLENISFEGETMRNVTIERGTSNDYAFNNIEFEVYSDCDPDISASVAVSAFFQSSCSDITLQEPEEGWIMNKSSNDQITLLIKDYDVNNMDQVIVEYAAAGTSSWVPGLVLMPEDLVDSPFGTEIVWNSNIPNDGAYNLRLKLNCGSSNVYSDRVAGLIDRTPPQPFGLPQPADDHYDAGDEIAINFTEAIDANGFNNNSVVLKRKLTDITIPAQLSVSGNKIIVIPGNSMNGLNGEMVEITLRDVKDVYGNLKIEPLIWNFRVGGDPVSLDFDNDGVADPKDLCQGFDDDIDMDNDGIPDGCDLCPEMPNVALDFDGTNDYVERGTIEDFDNTNNTVEAWIYFETLPAHRSWPLHIGNGGEGQHWILENDGRLHIGAWGQSNSQYLIPLKTREWTHIAAVSNGTDYIVYINGHQWGTKNANFTYTSSAFSLAKAISSGTYFEGKFDEVRVWNVARTQAEISATLHEELMGDESGLLLYYNFNEGTPETDNSSFPNVLDQSPYAQNGDLHNFEQNGLNSNWSYGAPVHPLDINQNGIGDVCDAMICNLTNGDTDGDFIANNCDNCPETPTRGMAFDGTNDFINTTLDELSPGNPVHTIELWMYIDALPSSRSWPLNFGHYNTGSHHWLLEAGGDLVLGKFAGGQMRVPFPVGEWTHVATVHNGSNYKAYFNGVLVGEVNVSFGTGNNNFYLGRRWTTGSERYFDGKMDDVRVWDVPRSQQQIQENMNRELMGTESNLVLYYNFNEGIPEMDNTAIPQVNDMSLYNNHGTLNNFSLNGMTSNWGVGGPVMHADLDQNGVGDLCEIALPLDFIKLSGKETEKVNQLEWFTTNEHNTAIHLVERSLNGRDFNKIGESNALGRTSGTHQYQWSDAHPLTRAYYRIRTIGTDGKSQLSNIILLNRREKSDFALTQLYPNPTDGQLNIHFNAPDEEILTVRILDITGRVVLQNRLKAQLGQNQIQMTVQNLTVGSYFVQLLRSDGTFDVEKLMVQD